MEFYNNRIADIERKYQEHFNERISSEMGSKLKRIQKDLNIVYLRKTDRIKKDFDDNFEEERARNGKKIKK